MSWRILATAASEPDFEQLSEHGRRLVNDDLFGWVDSGPPRRNRRVVAGVVIYEDFIPAGYRITYIVNKAEPYVAILRVSRA